MGFVQELCLVPSNLVNEIFDSNINVEANIKKTQPDNVIKDSSFVQHSLQ